MIAETGNCSPSMTPSTDHRAAQKKIQLIPVPIWSSAWDVPHEPPSAPIVQCESNYQPPEETQYFLRATAKSSRPAAVVGVERPKRP